MAKKNQLAAQQKQVERKYSWRPMNTVLFPQALRDAIPGPDLPDCDRLLLLSSIDGRRAGLPWYGQVVQLKMRVEESGKLSGAFDLTVGLTLEAARALAETLQKLTDKEPVA